MTSFLFPTAEVMKQPNITKNKANFSKARIFFLIKNWKESPNKIIKLMSSRNSRTKITKGKVYKICLY